MNLERLKFSTIMITGATGLIGKSIVRELMKIESINIIAVVRDKKKAEAILGRETKSLRYICSDIKYIQLLNYNVDYIIHGANQTSSRSFISEPVDTAETALLGTSNMLEIAKMSDVKGFVYLSTMEVYGYPSTDDKIKESCGTNLDTMSIRTCYPESKRMCENLCACYAKQYGVPAKIIRLTQTFGPGVDYEDSRVFAEFARCVIEEKNIILHTKGLTKRSYLHTEDAVSAVLTVLLDGKVGEAYNAANENTYCTIYEMASLASSLCINKDINVIIEEKQINLYGFAPVLHMNLDTQKLRTLGWNPQYNLLEMFKDMISSMKI